MTDTSIEAVESLIADIPGLKDSPQEVWDLQERTFSTLLALLAELEAEKRRNGNLRQIERNVQDERERQFKRAEAAEADLTDIAQKGTRAITELEARVSELEGALGKADALAGVIEAHATHRHAGKPYSPSMPKVFIALDAYQEARAALKKGDDNG